jgi:hypothetical protein
MEYWQVIPILRYNVIEIPPENVEISLKNNEISSENPPRIENSQDYLKFRGF